MNSNFFFKNLSVKKYLIFILNQYIFNIVKKFTLHISIVILPFLLKNKETKYNKIKMTFLYNA